MPDHKEFLNAGKKPGLQVWRVENMDLVPVPTKFYGEFFIGDSYVLLHTSGRSGHFSYNIHSWQGDESTVDESGAAVIFMKQMDDYLDGVPVQYCEFQNFESRTFLSYFKNGLTLKRGGAASGFNHVETNAVDVKRLLHVKGRGNIRITELLLSWDSFNTGDCFLIDLGTVIYIWPGSECNPFERNKSIRVAKCIRDNERNARAEIEVIDEGSEPEAILELLGSKPDLPPATCDKSADKANRFKATLYLISDATGSMETTVVAKENPFKRDMLSQNECYILDNGRDKKIFVWKGKNANSEERKAAFAIADKFIRDKNYSPKTQVVVMASFSESTLFKQFFSDWMDKDETTGLFIPQTGGRIAKVEDVPFDPTSLHTNKVMAAHYCMVDDGSGTTKIWRVEGSDKAPVDKKNYGQFFGGDCYLIHYTYEVNGREKHLVYFWQGQKCSQDELGTSALLAVQLDDSLGGRPTQVRVTQGKEPPHFVSIFKDTPLVIHLGGTSREGGDSETASTRLFHIRESPTKATRAVEVKACAGSLNSNDVFVLKSDGNLWKWIGKGATSEEGTAADSVAKLLGGTATEVKETEEPDSFWDALGGKGEYQSSLTLRDVFYVPRLFACSNKTGRLEVEEVAGEITQSDLAPDDVMILDTGTALLVWIGKGAREDEEQAADGIAKEYLDSDPCGRVDIPIYKMNQGEELPIFTGWFQAWDPDMWASGCYRY